MSKQCPGPFPRAAAAPDGGAAAGDDGGHDATIARLNALAPDVGWDRALREVYAGDPGMLSYVTDPARSTFIDLLPIGADTDVLEIGPGLGQFTGLLARRARSVEALEVDAGQARFTGLRCAQQGLTNVRVTAGGADCRLPYADASVDVVVLNLVFEWCALRCPDERQEDVQRRLLSEMSRVLRPGGTLYLATKNRFALRYLIGKSDEHCHHMRFGSSLPRRLARWLLRRRGHGRPGGLLHSYRGLATLLHDAGFAVQRTYWAAPDVRFPTHYAPTDSASVRAVRRVPGLVQGAERSTRLLMPWVPAPLVKHVAPGLAFLATKGDGRAPP
jgi:SAM-dependent methyltransferase